MSSSVHKTAQDLLDDVDAINEHTISVPISKQARYMLQKLVEKGIYGRTISEVALRFIDKELQDMNKFEDVFDDEDDES